MLGEASHQIVDKCHGRYAKEHTCKSKQSAANNDGNDNPERRKSGRVAQNLWSDDITIDLLQYDDKDKEVYSLGIGSVKKIMITVGKAPIYGPNTGMILVTPMMMDTRSGYGILKISIHT